MNPDDWFDVLRAALPRASEAPSEEETRALLDLARVAAHAAERWVAPVSTYLAGIAFADTPPADRVRALRELVDAMRGDTIDES